MPAAKPTSPRLRKGHRLSQGLVLGLPLTEQGGSTVYDASGNSNDGTLHTGVTFTAGQHGACLSFDGTANGYAVLGSTNVPTRPPVTVSCWIKASSLSGDPKIVARWNSSGSLFNWLLWITSASSKPTFSCVTAAGFDIYKAVAAAAIATGEWHHLVGVMTGGNAITIYLDGVATAGALDFNGSAIGGDVWLGAGENGASPQNEFTGLIDGLLIFNRDLTAAEVAQLYRDSWVIYRPDRLPRLDRSTVSDGITTRITVAPVLDESPGIQNTITFTSTVIDAEPYGSITTAVRFSSRVSTSGGDLASGRYRR